jgi:UDP-N-acetylmuramoylalanine--D-glutamate ligase
VIVSRTWRGKRYAVLGLARSGRATVAALCAAGAEVVAWDTSETARATCPAGAHIADPLTLDLTGFEAVCVSPGVPLNRHPIAAHAAKHEVPIIGDIELFAQARAELPPHKLVGITGTNGKSTTTALVHHICQVAGVPSLMGGNIGLPILEQEPLAEGGVYVLELSSYQIDLTHTLDCDIAVLLNITPDHLDRYDGFAGYAASKARLFALQSPAHLAIISQDDAEAVRVLQQLRTKQPPQVQPVSTCLETSPSPNLSLQGPHNAQNIAAARAVAHALGLADTSITQALTSFQGLPHRCAYIRTLAGVTYINDSKATNPSSTAPALAAYPSIHWICGGQAKSDSLEECAAHFSHVKAAYTIGEAGALFARLLTPHMPVTASGTLEQAVRDAAAAAQPGDTILLSPACASFDQFTDFEARGACFRELVEAL